MANPAAKNLGNTLGVIKRDAEERDTQRRAKTANLPYVDLRKIPISIEAMKILPETDAKAGKLAAIELKVRELALACFDPSTAEAKKVIDQLKQDRYVVKVFIASLSSLEQAWKFYEYVPEPKKEITGKLSISKERLSELMGRFTAFGNLSKEFESLDYVKATTTEIFEIIIAGALANKVSDVHLEAKEKEAKVRFRMDGILHDVFGQIPPRNYANLVSRLKLLAGLKINVRGEAQDGRYTISLPDRKEIEVRVSIIPAEFGDTIVMRILDPDSLSVQLDALGLRGDDLALLQEELEQPNGLILNTGPTGSGKTTTLYAFLKHVSTPEIKVITIEDPIEYRLEGIQQTQVDTEAGYTFASGLRSILRQDPDVILVGEIRDRETADIAMQAALTGHLVFSTLHTNDALGAVPRLVDLGIRPSTMGPALNLVIAQRLVRILCNECRKPVVLSPDLRQKIKDFITKLPARVDRKPYEALLSDSTEVHIYEPGGCKVCNGFGYRGRRGIFEFLRIDPDMEEVILRSPSQVMLRQVAQKQQMITMQQDGVLKTLLGFTSLAELESITGPIEW